MPPGLRTTIRWIAWVIDIFSISALAVIGIALDLDAKDGIVGTHVKWIQGSAAELVILFGALLSIARVVRWLIREKSREAVLLDRQVSDELDSFRDKCFAGLRNEPKDHNRVTIFKRVQWKWRLIPWRSRFWPWGWGRGPGSGWLVVVQRSGHATQLSSTVFLAPDDAPNAEGVAGHAWRINGAVRVRGLPDLNQVRYIGFVEAAWIRLLVLFHRRQIEQINPDYAGALTLVRRYAHAAGTNERWLWNRIKRGQRNPLSIVAVPLESADNERWGVLVIDSSNQFECIDTDETRFRRAITSLENCLKRCGVTR